MSESARKRIAENKARYASGLDATYLDLGNCGLTKWPDVSDMNWLETLILSNDWWEFDDEEKEWVKFNSQNIGAPNRLENKPPAYSNLPLLKKLVASNLGIVDWRFLENMRALEWLDLSGNQIENGRFLEKLTNLRTLNLSYNKIGDGRFLEKLTELTTLYLSDNQIKDGHFLEKSTGLKTLDLGANPIADWQFLGNMIGLKELFLGYNLIKDGQFLEKLTGLTLLLLHDNNIGDWQFLEKLTNLTTLYLSDNQINDGRFLEKLTKLTALDLSYNNIGDWQFLEKLTGLRRLELRSNQISDGRILEKLTKLTALDLSYNYIDNGRFLEKLTGLTRIVLTNNRLADLRPLCFFMEQKGMQLLWKDGRFEDGKIKVRGNPLEKPPIEIVKQGNSAILEYFRQKEQSGVQPLLEAKMVLLGDGKAGKTSLACRMLGKELPTEADRTQGVDIAINKYRFQVKEGDFVLHIWDFAGQDKYKPLHQFFYTEGAVYVMVVDSGNAQTDFADWFETAAMFGGESSPLVVALNEFHEGLGEDSFDEEKWRRQFPKLIKDVRWVNLRSLKGFSELERIICHLASQLPHTRIDYPANWTKIRIELERRRDENYISLPEFLKICHQLALLERESALILSGILHKIGVCLHYQESPLLHQHVILKNEWATAAVYKILEDPKVAEEKGFFNRSDLRRIWSDESYQDMQPQLLELMCKFKMAYPLHNPNEFVAPLLLPPSPPSDWDFPTAEAVEVRIEYKFLPKALMAEFIVSRHTDIDRKRMLVWRDGVVLRWSADTVAQVSKIKSRGCDAFQIQVTGSDRRGLLTAILKTLRDLHDTYRGIQALEIVPCPCEGCRTERNPRHFFNFSTLTNRLENGKRVVECEKSWEKVDLLKILGDFLLFERLRIGEAVVLKDIDQEKTVERKSGDIKIFLASSAELAAEREKIEIEVNRMNKDLRKQNIFLELLIWEDDHHIGKSFRSQDNYNRDVEVCDLFVLLFYSKLGKFTREEFQLAKRRFDKTLSPRILIFQKDVDLPKKQSREDANSRYDFLDELHDAERFPIPFENTEGLLKSFREATLIILRDIVGLPEIHNKTVPDLTG